MAAVHDDARGQGGRRDGAEESEASGDCNATCEDCGIGYRRRRAWHRHCPTCYAWRRAGTSIRAAARALRGAA